MKKLFRNKKGFTLMELVVGMVILGLIIALTAPLLMNQYQAWAAQSAAQQIAGNLNDVSAAATQYSVTVGSRATDISGVAATTLTKAGYLKTVPVPPSTATGAYAWDDVTYAATWAGSTNSIAVKLPIDSETICSKLNELYAGGAPGATQAAIDATKDLQCFGAAGSFTALIRVY